MKKKVSIIIVTLFLMISSITTFATEQQGNDTQIQAPVPSSVGETIAQTFPDPNLAQAVADELSGGDVNAILEQSMVDGFIQLNANYTDISDISGIETLTDLEYLSLGSNQITTIPDSIGNLTALKQLSLGYNQITALPDSIGNLSALESILLYNNKLTTLPESIGNLSKLQELWVYDNQLARLPESIGNLTELTSLRVQNNQLTSFPDSINQLSKLQEMDSWDNLLPTDFADTLNTFGWNMSVFPDAQIRLQLKSGLNPYIIQRESDINSIDIRSILEINRGGTPVSLSSEHQFVLENFVDENNTSVSLDTYVKNGVVQKTGKVFVQVRATGTGLFPNTSDNAITADKIELQFEATEYELAFNLNGASGAEPAKQMLIEGTTGVAVENPIREGYTFKGWNTSMEGSGTNWIPGTTPMLAQSITLYAQWESKETLVIPENKKPIISGNVNKATPKTGDDTNLLTLILLSVSGVIGMGIIKKRTKNLF